MKINSKDLYGYIDSLKTGEVVKFNVWRDDIFTGVQVIWDGVNFNWESGKFSSGEFFSPLYDFEIVDDKPEQIDLFEFGELEEANHYELKKRCNELAKATNYLLKKVNI